MFWELPFGYFTAAQPVSRFVFQIFQGATTCFNLFWELLFELLTGVQRVLGAVFERSRAAQRVFRMFFEHFQATQRVLEAVF